MQKFDDNKPTQVLCGDALDLLQQFPAEIFDAIITDPPYASGGRTLSEKQHSTADKYTNSKVRCQMPNFEGDAMDQRSWTRWMANIMRLSRGAAKPGAVLCAFSDWRQLPSLTDAIQWAGWIWRGIVVWDKTNSRPQRGRFRQQAEFIIWGSNGDMPIDRPVPVLPGVYHIPAPTKAKRRHQTEKPVELLRALVRVCLPGGYILDPFCGSGTTLHAAQLEGYRSVGMECAPPYAQIAQDRIGEI